MTQEEMTKAIYGDRLQYISFLENLMDSLEDTIWVLKNPDQYDYNEIYDMVNNLKAYCETINSDSRATGTLLKQLSI